MSHHRPFSPRPRRDALDRLLDTAVTPRAPADLAARIARDVPRLAQVTPLAADPASTTRHPAQPATHLKRRAARGWILAAGMGALAVVWPRQPVESCEVNQKGMRAGLGAAAAAARLEPRQ